MRNLDSRSVAEGGDGSRARPLPPANRGGFIDRHGLWSQAQYAAGEQVRRTVDEVGLELLRLVFADQHGVLHGKTITRDALPAALGSGITAPSSLLLKDTSGRSVFPVFATDTGVGVGGFTGAGDIVLVPDPATFRILPWTPGTGWMLCDLYFPDGSPVPFCSRAILRRALDALAVLGYDMTVGVELEFHVFRAAVAGADPQPTTPGSQLLHEEGLDGLDEVVQALNHGLTRLDLPLRSIELEFGPSQLEVTMAPGPALRAADAVTLCRSAIRQICRRHGFQATFMSRPAGAETASAGWHLHQSLQERSTGAAAFTASQAGTVLSDVGRHYLAGLLDHARAAAAFTTPTVNGYKRYRPFSLAPDRVVWGIDNKGAMVRSVGRPGDPDTRLENRSGEPAANPYFYIASQAISGADGLRRRLELTTPTADPYGAPAPALPRSLGEAIDHLEADEVFRDALGAEVIAWYAAIKRAEFDRYLGHVSDWEQREYFGLF